MRMQGMLGRSAALALMISGSLTTWVEAQQPANRAGGSRGSVYQRAAQAAPAAPDHNNRQPDRYPVSQAGGPGYQDAAPPQAGRPIRLVEAREQAVAQPAAQATNVPAAPSKLGPILPSAPGEHPLASCIRWAKTGINDIAAIKDYSCTLVKRERIEGELLDHEYMFVKVRHQPYSVYMYFLGPAKFKGQEAMYIRGANDGKMWAHPNGVRHKLIGTVSLNPTSNLAMAGNRYPITETGIYRLTERLIEVGEQDMQYGECEVKILNGAKINGRDCTCIQVVHPTPRKEFTFHLARIYVDNELNCPIRYEAYLWPKEPGGEPLLNEEYTYLNLKLNNGFTDQDFDIKNPNYQF